MALYFLRGYLPWQGLEAANDEEKYSLILEQKKAISVDELCKDLPQEFATCLRYIREINDPDKPDYRYVCNLFDGLYRRLGFKHDQVFDWTELEYARLIENAQTPSNVTHKAISKGKERDKIVRRSRMTNFRRGRRKTSRRSRRTTFTAT